MLHFVETATRNSTDLERVWSARTTHDTAGSADVGVMLRILAGSLEWDSRTDCQREGRAGAWHAIEK